MKSPLLIKPPLLLIVFLIGDLTGVPQTKQNSKSDFGKKLYEEATELEKKGDYHGALNKYEASLKLAEELGDKQAVAKNSLGAGYLKMLRGDHPKAMELFQRAKTIANEINDKNILATALAQIGTIHERTGQYKEAKEHYENAFTRAHEAKNQELMSRALMGMGNCYSRQGNHAQAIDHYQRSLKIAEGAGYRAGVGATLMNIGVTYARQGSYDEALDYYQRSLKIDEEAGDRIGTAITLINIGGIHKRHGSYDEAFQYIQRALKMREDLGDKRGIAVALNDLGDVHAAQGLYGKAIRYFQRALTMREEIADKRGIAVTLSNIGGVYAKQGSYREAVTYYQNALRLKEEIGYKIGIARTLSDIGNTYGKQGSYTEAVEYHQRALKISEEINAKAVMGEVLNNIGTIYLKLHQYRRAVKTLQQALSLGEETKVPQIIWEARHGLAGGYEKLANPTVALKYYTSAIEEIEKVRARARLEEGKAEFLASKFSAYEDLIRLLYQLEVENPGSGYGRQAFEYMERAKARALLESLLEARLDASLHVDAGLKQKEKGIFHRIAVVQSKLQKDVADSERKNLSDELDNLEEEHNTLKAEVRKANPRYAQLLYPEPLSLERIRSALVDKETALLEYLLGRDHAFVFLVTSGGLFIRNLEASQDLYERIDDYIKLLSSGGSKQFTGAAAGRRLYRDLVAPIAEQIPVSVKRLIVIPDGRLHYLPLESFLRETVSGPRYLIEAYRISYAPSATVLTDLLSKVTRPQTERKGEIIAFADPVYKFAAKAGGDEDMVAEETTASFSLDSGFSLPPLPFSSEEIKNIRRYAGGSSNFYQKERAREEAIKNSRLEDFTIIHFAVHGLLDDKVPARSALVLTLDDDPAEDGFLQAREVYNLKLAAELAVLSACQTGRGKLITGEGVLGLTRTFLYAGARSVVVSLWNINDQATARFMGYFYKHLSQGESKEEALRQAKLEMIHSGYSHPRYWAAFVLIGDYASAVNLRPQGVKGFTLYVLLALPPLLALIYFIRRRKVLLS
jgi:CHAT domain-containing protein/Tfp pilus assembly protein PilF